MNTISHSSSLLVLLVGLLFVLPTSSHSSFRDFIPNGHNVPHPCPSGNRIWMGVGHLNELGGGERNPFGLDFKANGFKYTKALCLKDSDGDGVINGVELGDPKCTWKVGEPAPGPARGHPGICEPLNSKKCKEQNKEFDEKEATKICKGGLKDCESKETADHIDLAFPKTKVPATETTYMCMSFNVTDLIHNKTADFHIVADEPILDNRNVIHHMLLYGCENENDTTLDDFLTPKACGMRAESTCSHTVAGWTVGSVGSCYDGIPAGTLIGKNGFKMLILEVHWNNPRNLSNQWDTPGMRLHYTDKLKKDDLGVITFGQAGLRIPPGKTRFKQTSTCSSACTQQQITKTMTVVSVGMHMHYIGNEAALFLIRGNKNITLAHDKPFSYDSPVDHNLNITVMAGDKLQVVCYFNSSKMKKHVYYGDATSDEMCYSYVTYYPKIGFNHCIQHGKSIENCNKYKIDKPGNCKIDSDIFNEAWDSWVANCNTTGGKTCTKGCKDWITSTKNPCVQDDARRYIEYYLGKPEPDFPMLNAMRSCDAELPSI